MRTTSAKTIDHDEIRQWIEDREGMPATVRGTVSDEGPGILRISFPGYGDDSDLQEISWEEFFDKFEDNNLAFLYQDETADGNISRFFKFINR